MSALHKDTTKNVKEWLRKNKTDLRSIKLMSREESMFKRYILEISVENLETVVCEKFWPKGVRVRIFRGRGNDWRDTEVPVGPVTEGDNEEEVNNS